MAAEPRINKALAALEPFIGEWKVVLSHCWFLETMDDTQEGGATFERFDNAYVIWRWKMPKTPTAVSVMGYSDAQEQYEMFYHDGRGVSRIFNMTFDGKNWTVSREDKDFYQRFVGTVTPDKIELSVEASDDQGKTWRKDFDLKFIKK